MSDVDRYFHEVWLGMVQPIDGLVVSLPVLVDAQCMERQPPHVQQKLLGLCPPTRMGEAGPEGPDPDRKHATDVRRLLLVPDASRPGDRRARRGRSAQLNEEPQPQVRWALGLSIEKPAWLRPSL